MDNATFESIRAELSKALQSADAATRPQVLAQLEKLTDLQEDFHEAQLHNVAQNLNALSDLLDQSIQAIRNQVDNLLLQKLTSLKQQVDSEAGKPAPPPAVNAGNAPAAEARPAANPSAPAQPRAQPAAPAAPGPRPAPAASAARPEPGRPRAAAGQIGVDLAALRAPHARFSGGVTWHLTATGLSISGAAPVGTGGEPQTVRRVWGNFGAAILQSAEEFRVPVELIVATICTESSGNPNAIRLEPGYVSDGATPAKVSPGLMQTLISTARDALPGVAIDRDWLFVPANSIRAGTAYIKKQSGGTKLDPPVVACAYNAGSVVENTGAGNRWRMRQFPIGTSEHCDRFVGWFNDCFRVFGSGVDVPSMSFFRLLN